MKLIIAGSRNFDNYQQLALAADWVDNLCHDRGTSITEVVSGKARGADTLGERWAEEMDVPVAEFPADWDLYGRSAGPIRNGLMAKYGEALLAFLAPDSKGTKDMIEQATRERLSPIVVICYDQ